jgi:hypothetical protein
MLTNLFTKTYIYMYIYIYIHIYTYIFINIFIKVLAIKVLEGIGQVGSKKVELEVDFKWLSNMQILLQANFDPYGEVIVQVANFQFSGVLRYDIFKNGFRRITVTNKKPN